MSITPERLAEFNEESIAVLASVSMTTVHPRSTVSRTGIY